MEKPTSTGITAPLLLPQPALAGPLLQPRHPPVHHLPGDREPAFRSDEN